VNNDLKDLLKVWDTSIELEIDSNKVHEYYNIKKSIVKSIRNRIERAF